MRQEQEARWSHCCHTQEAESDNRKWGKPSNPQIPSFVDASLQSWALSPCALLPIGLPLCLECFHKDTCDIGSGATLRIFSHTDRM